ncbi:MAG: hypothetical protein HZA92_16675 [Verrucomicrobia bacterium]|nr:hypothetical protein [Verrucomicrobiota bacterium]
MPTNPSPIVSDRLPTVDFDDIHEFETIPLERCDSPIEDMFLWDFKKVAAQDIRVRRQHECQTRVGTFRLDFMIWSIHANRRIGIECDGRDYHHVPSDARRDVAIVEADIVDRVYRFRGTDLCYRIQTVLNILGQREPWILSERGKGNLKTRCGAIELHDEWFGTSDDKATFPFVLIRRYDFGSEDKDSSTQSQWEETVIHWTEKIAGTEEAG